LGPLESLEKWDDFVQERYKPDTSKKEFRQFNESAPPVVRGFYRLKQTIWEAME
jgi:hypothetical protein